MGELRLARIYVARVACVAAGVVAALGAGCTGGRSSGDPRGAHEPVKAHVISVFSHDIRRTVESSRSC